jgi:hypothetical protein
VGVDIQRRGRLAMAQEARYRRHIRTVRNQKAGVAVTEAVYIQFSGNPFFFRISLNRQVKVLGVIGSWLSCLQNTKSSAVSSRFS